MKTISLTILEQLGCRLDSFIEIICPPSAEQTMIETLRRFLGSHDPELIESQVLADVQWGLAIGGA